MSSDYRAALRQLIFAGGRDEPENVPYPPLGFVALHVGAQVQVALEASELHQGISRLIGDRDGPDQIEAAVEQSIGG